jgi:hypothetical protein
MKKKRTQVKAAIKYGRRAKDVKVRKISWIDTAIRKQNDGKIILKDSLTGLYGEGCFNEFLDLEKKRCKRSEDPAFLMLANLSAFTEASERQDIAKSMMDVFFEVTRDTDVKGWYVEGLIIGIMFTEMTGNESTSRLALKRIANKCLWRLESSLGTDKLSNIKITWQSLKGERILEIHKVGSISSE